MNTLCNDAGGIYSVGHALTMSRVSLSSPAAWPRGRQHDPTLPSWSRMRWTLIALSAHENKSRVDIKCGVTNYTNSCSRNIVMWKIFCSTGHSFLYTSCTYPGEVPERCRKVYSKVYMSCPFSTNMLSS